MREPVIATQVVDVDAVFASEAPGTFVVVDNHDGITRLFCQCPCGCGGHMNLPIKVGNKTVGAWQWDGDREKPTLSPSIRDLSGCKFHGFLQAGVWTFTGDSGG